MGLGQQGRNSRPNKILQFWIVFLGLVLMVEKSSYASGSCMSEDNLNLMWQVSSSVTNQELKFMASKGINAIQQFHATRWSDEELSDYLMKAREYKLGVVIYLGFLMDKNSDGNLYVGNSTYQFINKWKDDTAIVAWHTFDEPHVIRKRGDRAAQLAAYWAIKKIDPNRPVLISHNLRSSADFERYFEAGAADIFEFHPYVDDEFGQREQKTIALIKQYVPTNRKLTVSLRAFNGGSYSPITQKNGLLRQRQYFCGSFLDIGIGYYGWDLSPNQGISNTHSIYAQFILLN